MIRAQDASEVGVKAGPEDTAELVGQARDTEAPLRCRQEAFGELVWRFQDLAYGYAYALLGDPHLAQDATQEAFLAAYRNLGQLRVAAAFPGWLRRIVRTQCRRFTRGVRPTISSLETVEVLAGDTQHGADPEGVAEARELRDALAALIRSLPERERTATVLFYVGGYSQNDIARFLGVPVTTVKKRLQAARKRLHETMEATMRDTLQAQKPSRDEQFVTMLRLLTAADAAAADGEYQLLELMVMDGVDLDAQTEDGATMLSWAARRGHLEAAAFLLGRGASANARDGAGKTPLRWAVETKHRRVADLLRQHGGTM
jgi:RNA polymerase sigma factor (sigma-70 family)